MIGIRQSLSEEYRYVLLLPTGLNDRMTPEERSTRQSDIPRDCEIVAYCAWPNKASSASVALKPRAIGNTGVRPLLVVFAE
jgi:hypothetical protein